MKKKQKGFTLLELLVVIGIIGILVGIGTISYQSAQEKSRDSRRRSDLKAISNALEQYYADNDGSYPSDADCAGYESYLNGPEPTDPTTGDYYVSASYSDGCSTTGYCICANLEGEDSGNSGSNCDYGAATKSHFCVENLQ